MKKLQNMASNTNTIKFGKKFDIAANLSIHVDRVPGIAYFKGFKLIPISNDTDIFFANPSILPRFYAGLTYLTGPNDEEYDDYKSSYNFGFRLKVKKNKNCSQYYYSIYHYRSYVEFGIYELTSQGDPRKAQYYCAPNDELLSNHDVSRFSKLLYEESQNYMQVNQYTPEDFVKYADSNLLIFGCLKGEYIFEQHKDNEAYKTRKEQLASNLDKKAVLT